MALKPGINPKVDFAFKKLFGSEANLDLLQDLLEGVLELPVGTVGCRTGQSDQCRGQD